MHKGIYNNILIRVTNFYEFFVALCDWTYLFNLILQYTVLQYKACSKDYGRNSLEFFGNDAIREVYNMAWEYILLWIWIIYIILWYILCVQQHNVGKSEYQEKTYS